LTSSFLILQTNFQQKLLSKLTEAMLFPQDFSQCSIISMINYWKKKILPQKNSPERDTSMISESLVMLLLKKQDSKQFSALISLIFSNDNDFGKKMLEFIVESFLKYAHLNYPQLVNERKKDLRLLCSTLSTFDPSKLSKVLNN